MSLIYIKGTPGTGKSTIRRELERRGYEAHDADDDDMGGPYNNETNQRVTYPDGELTSEWLAAHSYRLIPEAIEKLHHAAQSKPIFLCSTSSNEDDLWDLFDVVLFLDIDEVSLRQRIAQRTNNDYGKSPDELDSILVKYRADLLKRDRPGVIPINAVLPLDQVVSSIVKHANL